MAGDRPGDLSGSRRGRTELTSLWEDLSRGITVRSNEWAAAVWGQLAEDRRAVVVMGRGSGRGPPVLGAVV
jgi:hypothetical protein